MGWVTCTFSWGSRKQEEIPEQLGGLWRRLSSLSPLRAQQRKATICHSEPQLLEPSVVCPFAGCARPLLPSRGRWRNTQEQDTGQPLTGGGGPPGLWLLRTLPHPRGPGRPISVTHQLLTLCVASPSLLTAGGAALRQGSQRGASQRNGLTPSHPISEQKILLQLVQN